MPVDGTPTASELQRIRRGRTLAEVAADELETLIERERYLPGDAFPSERVLAESLGVSRTVVRDAVRTLAARGLLEIRPGSGSVVSTPSPRTIGRSMAHYLRVRDAARDDRKVAEVRRMLEIETARLAAERRSDEQLAALEELLAETRLLGRSDSERFAALDVSFHLVLAEATQNELFVLLHASIGDIMLSIRRQAFEEPGAVEQAVVHHRAVLDAVRAGDAARAAEAMAAHMEQAQSVMRRSSAGRERGAAA